MQHAPASSVEKDIHPWLHHIKLLFVPGQTTPLLEGFVTSLLEAFRGLGHTVQENHQHLLKPGVSLTNKYSISLNKE